MTTPIDVVLDETRSEFPTCAMFRSDEGVFYATRRGVFPTSEQFNAGICKTVSADDLPTLIELLRDQETGEGILPARESCRQRPGPLPLP